jgi:zinc/manganese transport system substrate-binding protein
MKVFAPRRAATRILLILTLALAGIPGRGAPLQIATLSTVLTEIAEAVGGDRVAVTAIVRPGVDPHTFEPAPHDLRVIAEADLVLGAGLGMEPYLDRLTANAGARGRIAEVGDSLAGSILYVAGDGSRREADPHWWNSVSATKSIARRVTLELTALRPGEGPVFAARAETYLAQLDALERWIRTQVDLVPAPRRQLVTTHDAFGWFARDYGFTVHPISGISPEAEPNARDLARLIDLIRNDHLPAIFVESTANPRLVTAVVEETGVKLGGELYPDGLMPDGEGATYAGMMRHNVRTIVDALR